MWHFQLIHLNPLRTRFPGWKSEVEKELSKCSRHTAGRNGMWTGIQAGLASTPGSFTRYHPASQRPTFPKPFCLIFQPSPWAPVSRAHLGQSGLSRGPSMPCLSPASFPLLGLCFLPSSHPQQRSLSPPPERYVLRGGIQLAHSGRSCLLVLLRLHPEPRISLAQVPTGLRSGLCLHTLGGMYCQRPRKTNSCHAKLRPLGLRRLWS